MAKMDFLSEKEKQAMYLGQASNDAVYVVQQTIVSLEKVNAEIASTISEINEHLECLETTKQDLSCTREQNESMISNFRTLIPVDRTSGEGLR